MEETKVFPTQGLKSSENEYNIEMKEKRDVEDIIHDLQIIDPAT